MGFKDNPVFYLTKKTWEFSKGNRSQVVLYVFLFVCANIINFFEPLIVAHVLNTIQTQGISSSNLPSIILTLSLFIFIWLGFWAFHGPARVIELRNSFLVRANYKKYLVDGTMDLPPEWHTDHHSGDTIDKIEKGTHALFEFSGHTFEVIEFILKFVGSYIALAYFNIHSAYIVLFIVIMTLTIIVKFDKVLVKQYLELFRAENRITAKIFDVISNITTVIILRVEKLVSKAIVKKIMAPFRLFVKNRKLNEIKWFLVSCCSSLMIFTVLLSYIISHLAGNQLIMVGTIYALYGYVQRINNLFFRFAYKYGEIVRQRTAVSNAEEISDDFRAKKKTKQIKLDSDWRRLFINDLNFAYQSDEEGLLHLDSISMSIKRKEKIALVGASGSGKTTLLKIIRDMYHPHSLELFLDKKLVKKGFASISENITLVPQDPEIFTSTIKENITLGVGYKMDHIKRFTDMACFTDVAENLPNKFNSSIVEKGVNLSGGEKQRLALARGLLACERKSIALLDEPTSSVDAKTELIIYKNIFKAFNKKTIISSIHRLHLLPLFDRIYLFRGGKIVASGTLKELLKTSKEFKKRWDEYMITKHVEGL